VVALDLALGHRVIRLAAGVRHAMLREPGPELSGEVQMPEKPSRSAFIAISRIASALAPLPIPMQKKLTFI
jgi:hypothetical protein